MSANAEIRFLFLDLQDNPRDVLSCFWRHAN
jgi:hypothetical protein